MSYILDALKKSDQERQQGNSPHLYSMHSSAPPRRNLTPFYRRRGFWLPAGGVLLLCACLGIFLLINRHNVPPLSPAPQQTNSGEQIIEPAVHESTRQVALPEARQKSQTIAAAAEPGGSSVPQVIIKENRVVVRAAPLKENSLPAQEMVPATGKAAAVAQLQDLPADIQAAVPELQFAGHTYSEEPAQRMIIVNGQIVREGDTIAAGTRLAQITWDGVIVNFQGNRFLVKTN